MKVKATYILAILLPIFSVLIISCSQQNTKWKGTMEEVDGVTIVKIPLGFFPRTWKNKKLYTIEEDEESYLYVKRYKVTWKL